MTSSLIRTNITECAEVAAIGYEVVRMADGQIIAEGEKGHVITDSKGRVRSFPEGFAQRLRVAANCKGLATGGGSGAERDGAGIGGMLNDECGKLKLAIPTLSF